MTIVGLLLLNSVFFDKVVRFLQYGIRIAKLANGTMDLDLLRRQLSLVRRTLRLFRQIHSVDTLWKFYTKMNSETQPDKMRPVYSSLKVLNALLMCLFLGCDHICWAYLTKAHKNKSLFKQATDFSDKLLLTQSVFSIVTNLMECAWLQQSCTPATQVDQGQTQVLTGLAVQDLCLETIKNFTDVLVALYVLWCGWGHRILAQHVSHVSGTATQYKQG